jgi:hypothetical protein
MAADAEASVAPSPTLTDAPVMSVAQIPVGGGPEFTVLDDAYLCGDPAPAANPSEQDLALTVEAGVVATMAPESTDLEAQLTFEGTDDAGTATIGWLTLLLVRDGRIAGVMHYGENPGLAWDLQPGAERSFQVGPFTENFTCERRSAHAQHAFFESTVEPGEYDVMAVARVFSTEESVALGQALPSRYYLDEGQARPGGIYLPGSYDCVRLKEWGAMVRGCLPDVTSDAWMEDGLETVSVRYDASALVAPFYVTLASESLPVTLASWAEVQPDDGTYVEFEQDPVEFESVDQVVCGAVAADPAIFTLAPKGVEVWATLPALESLSAGTYQAEVMPWLAQDGSTVRLEAGARLAYARYLEPTSDQTSWWPTMEIVGFAPVSLSSVVNYDRYAGPSHAPLDVGEPEPCPPAGEDSIRRAAEALLVGTWVVTAPNGAETRHELVIPTRPLQ